MEVHGRLAPGRELGVEDFADITTAPVLSADFAPGGLLRVEFDGDLSDDEAWRVRNRIQSASETSEAARLAVRDARDAALAVATCDCPTCHHALTLALLLANKELGET